MLVYEIVSKTPKVGYSGPSLMILKKGNRYQDDYSHFNLDLAFEDAYAFQRSEVIRLKTKIEKIKSSAVLLRNTKCWKNGLITY
jgi:hypothetical protein